MIRLKGWTSDMHHTRAARLDGDATVLHASACVAERDLDYRRAMLHRTMAHAKQMQARWHERRCIDMERLNRPIPFSFGTVRHVPPHLIEDINPSPREYALGGIREFNQMRGM